MVIKTTKFGEFLPNRLGGDSMTNGQTETDGADYNIPPVFFFKKHGDSDSVVEWLKYPLQVWEVGGSNPG